MRAGTLLIRADANATMGTGHVMRCLALAQAWQDAGGKADFAMAESTPAIRTRIGVESCDVFTIPSPPGTTDDLRQTIAIATPDHYDWIAIDGYQFGADYQRGLKAGGFKVLFLDDYGHSHHYSADFVLNQNISAAPDLYANREEHTELLLGPKYALLRREFETWIGWERTIAPLCRRVLVTLGGSDGKNITAVVIEAIRLARTRELEATVIVGGSNPNFEKLQGMAAQNGLTVLKDVSRIGELMAESDAAISAAGTTCWELCLLGLPSLLIDVAENQTALAQELQKRGCAIHVGNGTVKPQTIAEKLQALAGDQLHRQLLSNASRQLVDGRGAMRVVSLLRGTVALRLRPVRNEDCRLLWKWANDPEVRAASLSSDPIPWETHDLWFREKHAGANNVIANCRMFIAENEEGASVGQIRFERRPDEGWDVGVSVSKPFRSRGLGGELIARGVRELVKGTRHCFVHAYIKPENIASIRSFERASFQRIGSEQLRGHSAVHLVYEHRE